MKAAHLCLAGILVLIAVGVAALQAGCSTPGGARATPAPASATVSSAGVEDIYIFRSLREQRSAPDEFCAASKIGFTAKVEDRYAFKAVITQAPDGKVVDARAHEAGSLHACFDGAPGLRRFGSGANDERLPARVA